MLLGGSMRGFASKRLDGNTNKNEFWFSIVHISVQYKLKHAPIIIVIAYYSDNAAVDMLVVPFWLSD